MAPIRRLKAEGVASNSERKQEDIATQQASTRLSKGIITEREAGMMNEIERETTIASLQKLSARLETLGHLDIADLLLPGQQKHYEQTLEDAYATLAEVETALDKLGQELEFQHQRLGGTVEHYAQGEGATLLLETRPEAPGSRRYPPLLRLDHASKQLPPGRSRSGLVQ